MVFENSVKVRMAHFDIFVAVNAAEANSEESHLFSFKRIKMIF